MSKSTSKSRKEENLANRATNLAHELLLANLGLAGKVYERSQELYQQTASRYRKVYNDRQKIFKQLVKRGEKVQKNALTRFEYLKEERKAELEQRLENARERLDRLTGQEQHSKQSSSQSKAA